MWTEDATGAAVVVVLLSVIVLFAYLVAGLVAGLGSTGWIAASDLPFYCRPEDGGLVGCLREWIDPVAAIFTVAAIIFAARQVFEANRQSDAAVREASSRSGTILFASCRTSIALTKCFETFITKTSALKIWP